MKKKIALVLLALVLVVGATIGGTLAWLTAKTDPVTNVFTTADIGVTLIETLKPDGTETKDNDDNVQPVTDWSAQMIPGYTYSKNPKVTVTANSVDCYLFVKFEVTGTATALEYTSNLSAENSDWTQGTGTEEGGNGVPTNVWFRVVTSSTSDQSWELLKDNQVKISDNLTKENMPSTENAPKLNYTAYASQYYQSAGVSFTPAQAWNNVPKS